MFLPSNTDTRQGAAVYPEYMKHLKRVYVLHFPSTHGYFLGAPHKYTTHFSMPTVPKVLLLSPGAVAALPIDPIPASRWKPSSASSNASVSSDCRMASSKSFYCCPPMTTSPPQPPSGSCSPSSNDASLHSLFSLRRCFADVVVDRRLLPDRK